MAASIRRQAVGMAVLGLVVALAGCGDGADAGAGAGGGTGLQPPGGSGTTATTSVTVSAALPVSGNGAVTGTGAVSSLLDTATRRVVADGAAGGIQHRFTIDYDPVSGVVLGVAHGWGASLSSLEGATACVRAVTVLGQVACGSSVAVDVARSQASFTGTVLRGSGSLASILTGQITFTVR